MPPEGTVTIKLSTSALIRRHLKRCKVASDAVARKDFKISPRISSNYTQTEHVISRQWQPALARTVVIHHGCWSARFGHSSCSLPVPSDHPQALTVPVIPTLPSTLLPSATEPIGSQRLTQKCWEVSPALKCSCSKCLSDADPSSLRNRRQGSYWNSRVTGRR